VQYRVDVNHSVDTVQSLPANIADPWYEHYAGPVVPLYCTGFESDPEDEGWTFEGESADLWTFGAPVGQNGDPDDAFIGLAVLGTALGDAGTQGLYPPLADAVAVSPPIDTSGYAAVRLQYWRWLEVEDGFYDRASISADGEELWANYSSPDEEDASTHHLDGEWRFHDVDLSSAAADGDVRVAFSLASDGGLEFGGWNLDELCIVGVEGPPPTCGDGALDLGEECDDGNDVDDDGCSGCTIDLPDTGGDDGGAETGDETGFGSSDDGDIIGRGCGCSSPGVRGRGSLALGVAALILGVGVTRRRRTR
jgi:cysteine-rich repeat protein